MINIIDLGYVSDDGNIYYYIVLDLVSGEYFMIKNASCLAVLEKYLEEKYNLKWWEVQKRFKVFFNKTDSNINLDNVYKKYHHYFK